MHVSGLHLRTRIGRLAGALATRSRHADPRLGRGRHRAGRPRPVPQRDVACRSARSNSRAQPAASSSTRDTIPAVPGQGCNATVALDRHDRDAGRHPAQQRRRERTGSYPDGELPAGPAPSEHHLGVVAALRRPGDPSVPVLRLEPDGRHRHLAPTQPEAEVRVCPAAWWARSPVRHSTRRRWSSRTRRASSGWHRHPATSATGWSPGVARPRPSATPPG